MCRWGEKIHLVSTKDRPEISVAQKSFRQSSCRAHFARSDGARRFCVSRGSRSRGTGHGRVRKGVVFFKQGFELRINGDLIPEAAAEEIIGELQALFARHNAGATS